MNSFASAGGTSAPLAAEALELTQGRDMGNARGAARIQGLARAALPGPHADLRFMTFGGGAQVAATPRSSLEPRPVVWGHLDFWTVGCGHSGFPCQPVSQAVEPPAMQVWPPVPPGLPEVHPRVPPPPTPVGSREAADKELPAATSHLKARPGTVKSEHALLAVGGAQLLQAAGWRRPSALCLGAFSRTAPAPLKQPS
ncbi:unnamed protein product [Rangifer tarandus platyrhynchus]|uniref:Uncharacterized protein n=1 Tax=Rangifer tarandus platyrhynchus TaxID=3082113 RepID=A0AC59YTJ2_RANTA